MREDYVDIIRDFAREKYGREPITLTHQNTALVTNFSVQKGTYDRALELRCPAGRIMAMCGSEDGDVDRRDFARSPHLYSIPHPFSIRCFGKDSAELSPCTMIRIEKVKPSGEMHVIDNVLYGDLSLAYGERFKRKEERYYFSETVRLYGEQILRLMPVVPDMDIARTELFMKCDLFTREV